RYTHRARFLVDASGRDGFLASRIGRRSRVPNLGKVAAFAHVRGGRRFSGREVGNVRIYLFDGGWFWWIPMSNDLASVGAVVHARDARAYERRVWRGVAPFFKFIHKYYEPSFLDLFLQPREKFGMVRAVLNVLSGGAFIRMPWRVRASLALLFGIARVNTWVRRRAGKP